VLNAREWRTWRLSRRIIALAVIVIVGIAAGLTNTLFAPTRLTLAAFALCVAVVACAAVGWLGVQWYASDPRRD
jgi:hypothetical protein